MKKIVSLVLAVLMAVTLLCGCAKNQSASPSPFVGTWVCDYDPSGYPAQMVLRADGSGIADGVSVVWSANETDSEFLLVGGLAGKHQYTYAFDGSNTLYLGDYRENEVMYEKIG